MKSIDSEDLPQRMRAAVSLGWRMFSRKVGNGVIPINKEASMQLQYAYVLQQLLPLITFHEKEAFQIELETGVNVAGSNREVDLLFSGVSPDNKHRIAIEMKCYRKHAASGQYRGASDIFMKDVYVDLSLLEQYVNEEIADQGVALVMNDLPRLVNPKVKNGKCWAYDISDGVTIEPGTLDTPIGGKPVEIKLRMHYSLHWQKHGSFWFLEAQGKVSPKK